MLITFPLKLINLIVRAYYIVKNLISFYHQKSDSYILCLLASASFLLVSNASNSARVRGNSKYTVRISVKLKISNGADKTFHARRSRESDLLPEIR